MHYSFRVETFKDGALAGTGGSSVIADSPEEAEMLVARQRAEFAERRKGFTMETGPVGHGSYCECCRPKDGA